MNILKIRMTLIPYLFLRVLRAKNVVTYMCKNSHFRLSFQKEHGKRVSTLFKFERQNLYHIYWSTRRQLSCKKSLLVLWKRSRLFVNTTSAVDKCSLPNRDNLMQPIHRILSFFFFFFFFFFYLGFVSRTFTIHGTGGEGGGYLFNSTLPLPPASQTLRH